MDAHFWLPSHIRSHQGWASCSPCHSDLKDQRAPGNKGQIQVQSKITSNTRNAWGDSLHLTQLTRIR